MIDLKIDGSQANKKAVQINGLADGLSDVVYNEIVKGAHRIRTRTIKSISRGLKTGGVYLWRGTNPGETPDSFRLSARGKLFPVKQRNKPHRASAPGQAPATDTGELISKIIVDERRNSVEVGATKDVPYAPWLEDGTRGMKARPFLEPALEKEMNSIESGIISSILMSASRKLG